MRVLDPTRGGYKEQITAASHHHNVSNLPTNAYKGDKVTPLDATAILPSHFHAEECRFAGKKHNTPETLTERQPCYLYKAPLGWR